jgi:divalent metal cation (Fe/Co/Zn/Cd) transporter
MPAADVKAALRISVLSIIWTVSASTASVIVGVRSATAVLVAFGAIGIVDAVGSVALSVHFRHGLRHDALSDELERIAHVIVLVGLFCVGCAALVAGVVRLALSQASAGSDAGVVIAAASLVALVCLSARKQQVARRVASAALRSDGHLSAIGAVQAAVTLAGTVTARWWGWTWADSAATAVLGGVAVALSIVTWRAER